MRCAATVSLPAAPSAPQESHLWGLCAPRAAPEYADMTTTALSRLNLWQKLGALVLAMILPAILVGFFYFTAMGGQLSQARDELAGARYLSAVEEIESAVLTHAGRAFAVASGDAASRSGASAARN